MFRNFNNFFSRQFYIITHYINFFLVIIGSIPFNGFYFLKWKGFVYIFSFFYCLTLKFFSLSCKSPGHPSILDPELGKNGETELFYCKKCQQYIPVRACHCNVCNKCVLRRDHHCQWLGQCVGRDNHVYFLLLTFFEFVSDFSAYVLVLKGVILSFKNKYPLWNRILLIYLLPWCFVSFLFALNLLFVNVSNMLSNVTVWELKRWNQISYLRPFTKNARPFNRGMWNNIKEFFTMKSNKLEYKQPRPTLIK